MKKNKIYNRTILIVEDDQILSTELANQFKANHNIVYVADNLVQAKKYIMDKKLDAIILDIILPDGEGLDLFLEFGPLLPPVVILTSLGEDYDILEGFSRGACDYVVKPCSFDVLEARLYLRLLPKADAELSLYGLTINLCERTAHYNGHLVNLTSSEFNILCFLMEHAGIYFTADVIYENIWKMPSLNSTSIRYHLSNLRQKLDMVTGNKNLIVTQFGKGYCFIKGR